MARSRRTLRTNRSGAIASMAVSATIAFATACSPAERPSPVESSRSSAAQQDVEAADAGSGSTDAEILSPALDAGPDGAAHRAPATTMKRSARKFTCSTLPSRPAAAITAPGTVQCTFVLDPEIPEDAYDAVLVLPDGRTRRRHGIESGRRIRFDDVERGYVSLVVELWPSQQEIEHIDSIAVPEAGTTNDKRLDIVDLRGRVRALRARVLGARNEPLGLADVGLDDGAGHAWTVKTDAEGRLDVFVPIRIPGVDAKVNGYRTAVLYPQEVLQLVPE